MANTSTIHIKTDFDCKVFDYGQELGLAQANTFCNFELRKGEHELTYVYTEDESISKTITYEVKDADCDYRLIIELAEIICDKAIELYDSENYSCAFTLYSLAAEKGLAKAQNGLGECYYFGNGVEKDRAKAVEWYTKAAEQGYAPAQNNLGNCYNYGNGVKHDRSKAIEWYTKAAEQENIKAQKSLGLYYALRLNTSKAVEWYSKAAEQGDAFAQYFIGCQYERGKTVEKSLSKAIEWYTRASNQGYASAQHKLGLLYYYGTGIEKNYSKTVEWLTKAVENGDDGAKCDLSFCYEYGIGVKMDLATAERLLTEVAQKVEASYIGNRYEMGLGLEKNLQKAVKWYIKDAEQGNIWAQCKLGYCYKFGNGVEKDLAKAVEWFTKAAEKGDADAQCNLGYCYFDGHGVEKDPLKAVEWYTKAAEQGNANAQYNLGYCYKFGKGVEKDLAKAVEWFTKAAEKGDAKAQCDLGYCYQYGKGLEKNITKAIEWYTKALLKNENDLGTQFQIGLCYYDKKDFVNAVKWFHKAASSDWAVPQIKLGDCYYNGIGVEKNLTKAVEWYTKAAWCDEAKKRLDEINNQIKKDSIYYLFFDTETTGIPSDYHAPTSNLSNWPRLVQLSWITTDKDCNIIAQNNFIIYPEGFVIPSDAVRLHGITTDIAKEQGEPLDVVIDKFMKDFNAATTIIGHNIAFDKKIIGAELIRLGQKDIMNSKRALCTMETGTNYCKIPGYHGYKWPRLQELHKKLFGYEFEDAHNSMSDVTATLKCFKEMRKRGLI